MTWEARQAEARANALVLDAKDGSEQAAAELLAWEWSQWARRVCSLYTHDGAYDRDDLQGLFYEHALRAIPDAVMGRGSAARFIGQRAYWRVSSEVRAANKHFAEGRRALQGADLSEMTELGAGAVPDGTDELVARIDAGQTVHVMLSMNLDDQHPAAARALHVMARSDRDPREPGYGRWLAGLLGVSPQRVSQLIATIRARAEESGAGS